MAKKTETEKKVEDEANQKRNEETVKAAAEIGQADSGWLEGMNEADPFERMLTLMPGKPGFDRIDQAYLGEFVRSKKVVNEKSLWARVDTDPKSDTLGKKIVYLMVLKDPKGVSFGIWGVGAIRAAAMVLKPGTKIQITYRGVADEALKPGQNPPHLFKFIGKNPDGSPLKFDWDAYGDDDVEVPHTATTQSANFTRQ